MTAVSITDDGEALLETQAAQIAESLMRLIRIQASIKAKVLSAEDGDASATMVLVDLVKNGPRRATDLAGQICADPSTVSRQVAALVKAGLVARKADPEDGRASILVPTESGVAQAHSRISKRGRSIGAVVASWPESDRTAFVELLSRFETALEAQRDAIVAAYRTALEEES